MSASFFLVGAAMAACVVSMSAVANGDGGGQGGPASRPADVIHFHRVSITDPQMQGAEACTLLVPADWKTDGGIVWDLQGICYPAGLKLQVSNPAGDQRVGFYPAMHFVWFTTPMGQQLKPQGTRYLGSWVQPVVGDCKTALARVAWPVTHGNIPGAKATDFQDLPDFAKACQANLPQLPGVTYDVHAGKLRVQYADPQTGAAMEEDFIGVLTVAHCPALGSDGWHLDHLMSYKAPAGQLDQAEKEMEAVTSSLRVNVHWFAGYVQVTQTLMQIVQNASNAAVQRSQIIFQAQQQISDGQMKSWQQQQDASEKCNAAWDRIIRGVDVYQGADGSQVELPNTYSHAWSNGNGDYVMSNNSLYNPNVSGQGSWQELKPAKQ